ncbi:MAG: glycosyltransferase family 2 protein [Candidatus Sericytochromatia bacterium]|nr:glycosyltransferase family 2 protein [Candidatus Tanganyikabacteria bacterium]
MDPVLSVVVPIFNEEAIVPELHSRLTSALGAIGETYEVLLINDGSRDRSLDLMRAAAAADSRVRVVDLSRNFGHQIAITAGMDYARGKAVVVIDADLQDPPEVIAKLVARWREGYQVVYAVREHRVGETAFKKVTAAAFYRLIRRITNVDIPVDTGDFRLMDRSVVDALKRIREKHRFVRGLVSWVGFRQTGVTYVRQERFAGETKYPLRKMLKFAFDGITSFSFVPLQMATYLGFAVSGLSFLAICWVLVETLVFHETVQGWSSLMVAVLFLGGIQLMTIGLIGEYVGRIYDEVKGRPLYLVREEAGSEAPRSHEQASASLS